jgi:hypothetical protein
LAFRFTNKATRALVAMPMSGANRALCVM